ncbi:MAG: YjgN family protein [Cellvibrionaceae bacterium]|nr:YjgN family protein [Cellvibrionaceae bacterium]MCV6625116.1 YjgN family protein [Cellvibrionaceae bacterium]
MDVQTETASDNWQSVKFHGKGSEYFGIWIVNLVLTLLTLGIYSAWATVRNRRYFYGNTEVAGGRFDFHGTGLQILIGRIIAVVLLIGWSQGSLIHPYVPFVAMLIVLGLLPWFLVRAWSFRLRNTSLRNLRFGFSGSVTRGYRVLTPYLIALIVVSAGFIYFTNAIGALQEQLEAQRQEQIIEPDESEILQQEPEALLEEPMDTQAENEGEEKGLLTEILEAMEEAEAQQPKPSAEMDDLMIRFMGFYLLALLAIACLTPLLTCDMRNFNGNFSQYGKTRFNVELKRGKFFEHFWTAVGINMAAGIVMMIVILILGLIVGLMVGVMGIEIGEVTTVILIAAGGFLLYLLFLASYLGAYAFWLGRVFNDTFNTLSIGDVEFRSRLTIWPYARVWIINTVLMLFTLGFAYPWIKVRLIRFQLENIDYRGDTEAFIAHNQDHTHAIGDEVGEAFDFDFGF